MHDWHLLIELSDSGDEMPRCRSAPAGRAARRPPRTACVHDAALATSGAQRAKFWEIRHSVSEANKKAGVGLTTDTAVPVSALPAFIAQRERGGARDRARPADPDRRAPRRRQRPLHPVLRLRDAWEAQRRSRGLRPAHQARGQRSGACAARHLQRRARRGPHADSRDGALQVAGRALDDAAGQAQLRSAQPVQPGAPGPRASPPMPAATG